MWMLCADPILFSLKNSKQYFSQNTNASLNVIQHLFEPNNFKPLQILPISYIKLLTPNIYYLTTLYEINQCVSTRRKTPVLHSWKPSEITVNSSISRFFPIFVVFSNVFKIFRVMYHGLVISHYK